GGPPQLRRDRSPRRVRRAPPRSPRAGFPAVPTGSCLVSWIHPARLDSGAGGDPQSRRRVLRHRAALLPLERTSVTEHPTRGLQRLTSVDHALGHGLLGNLEVAARVVLLLVADLAVHLEHTL